MAYKTHDLSHLSVLISGAGVALALALSLARYGARVTVVEKAPALREPTREPRGRSPRQVRTRRRSPR